VTRATALTDDVVVSDAAVRRSGPFRRDGDATALSHGAVSLRVRRRPEVHGVPDELLRVVASAHALTPAAADRSIA